MDLASVESIETELLLSDLNNLVKITFNNGKILYTQGDISSLNGKIKYLLKKRE